MYKTNFSNNVSELVKTYIPNPRLRSSRKGLLLQPQQLRTETCCDGERNVHFEYHVNIINAHLFVDFDDSTSCLDGVSTNRSGYSRYQFTTTFQC